MRIVHKINKNIIVYKLLLLDRNNLYHVAVPKQLIWHNEKSSIERRKYSYDNKSKITNDSHFGDNYPKGVYMLLNCFAAAYFRSCARFKYT